MVRPGRHRFVVAAVLVLMMSARQAVAQAVGRVTGTITNAETKAPLLGVIVKVVGTQMAAQTATNGHFTIANVPVGTVTVEARLLGFTLQRATVTVVKDGLTTFDAALAPSALQMDAMVVSATSDPMSAAKAPFAIVHLTEADLPVSGSANAVQSLQGKVAGLSITRGGGPSGRTLVQLRSVTSQFKGTEPLYVIDGIVLTNNTNLNTPNGAPGPFGAAKMNPLDDINPEDIENVEVIMGAAGASLYGSRGASGVITITTKRGKGIAVGTTEFNFKSEYGAGVVGKTLSKPAYHNFKINAQGQWVDLNGQVVPKSQRVVDGFGFVQNPYATIYDQPKQFFKAGQQFTNTISMSQNSANTNFNANYSIRRDPGVILNSDGITRQTVKLNLDHRIKEKLTLSTSLSYGLSFEDPSSVNFQSFYDLAPDVNLLTPNLNGSPYKIHPDSADPTGLVNPLYVQSLNDNRTKRASTLLGLNVGFRPTSWLNISGNMGYDRTDRNANNFVPRGIPNTNGTETLTLGSLSINNTIAPKISGELRGTASHQFGELRASVGLATLLDRATQESITATGTDFTVAGGVKSLSVARTYTESSTLEERRTSSYNSTLTLDYGGRYIGDFVVRREGSSLFGPGHRWATYGRAAGSWLVAEEKWWPFASINQFKLRYSRATAGTQPDFDDQYFVLSIPGTGRLARNASGNTTLQPVTTTEQEMGLDMTIKNRVEVTLTRSSSRSVNDLISLASHATSGFGNLWGNVGITKGLTSEVTIRSQLLRRKNVSWESSLVMWRPHAVIEKFGRSCFMDQFGGQFYHCEGSVMGDLTGVTAVRQMSDLPAVHKNSTNQFDTNDEGYVVAVGAGNTYKDGVSKKLWGTNVVIDGRNYAWGLPTLIKDSTGLADRLSIVGHTAPKMQFGFNNTITLRRNLALYAGITGQIGGDIYNETKYFRYSSGMHPDLVQVGKPEELKKPPFYYNGGSGNSVPINGIDGNMIESAQFLKLNELQLRYTLPNSWTRLGSKKITANFTARNVFTWSNYSGIDPEVSNAQTTLQTVRYDNSVYPLVRTYSAGVNIVF
ncbi:MAG: SusC/RagA family TonB-linked outer membrane protein [Gemmatimonas sp.]